LLNEIYMHLGPMRYHYTMDQYLERIAAGELICLKMHVADVLHVIYRSTSDYM